MRRIAIEEHFSTKDYLKYLGSTEYNRTRDSESNRRLIDVGQGRLQEMDKAGIDMQVLSLISGVEDFDALDSIKWARKTNDDLAKVVKKYPERFAGLAALPMQEPGAAADELERAVKKLGLRGAKISSHVRGEYLDNRKYWGVFEKAQKLDVPIYIHPKRLSANMMKPYSAYPGLSSAMLGYGAEASLNAMRLILSGVFDKYPHLKIILGHLGEALPFWAWRIDNMWQRTPESRNLRKKPSEYLRDNFFFTTSGMFWQPALLCVYLAFGADKMLFAVDYPFESNELAIQSIDTMPICDSDKEKIYHVNTEKLLAL